jgi:hypothetical protein
MESCAICGQPMICGHTLGIDGGRRLWRVCCLCTAELIARLDPVKEPEAG